MREKEIFEEAQVVTSVKTKEGDQIVVVEICKKDNDFGEVIKIIRPQSKERLN